MDRSNQQNQYPVAEKAANPIRREGGRDSLTGLVDRPVFTQMLREETRRNSRSSSPLSLIIVGMDYFSAYNNIHGSASGDVCLQVVAECLRDTCKRAGDLIARLDSDEFGIILPATSESAAVSLAEKLVADIAALGITNNAYAAKERGIITISAGVATNQERWDMDGKSLWVVADQGLLHAKKCGRNQVCKSAAQTSVSD